MSPLKSQAPLEGLHNPDTNSGPAFRPVLIDTFHSKARALMPRRAKISILYKGFEEIKGKNKLSKTNI